MPPDHSPSSIAELFARAMALHRAGDLDRAASAYRDVLAIEPRHANALTNLGAIHLQKRDFDGAREMFEASLRMQPNQPNCHHNLGIIFQQEKRFEEALSEYDRAIALDSRQAGAYNNRSVVLRNLMRFEEALASCDRAVALHPSNAEAHNNRGRALQALKKPEEALAAYDRAIALNPSYAEAHNNRAMVLHEMMRLEDALRSYERAVMLQPGFAIAWNNCGNLLKDLGRLEDALTAYDRAVALSADLADAWNNRGIALQELGRLEDALVSYDRSFALDPGSANLCNNRGNVLQDLQRPDEALVCYDRAIALNSEFPDAWNNRGNVLKRLRRYDEALASYDRAISLRPDFADAWWNKALLKLLLGDYEEGWRFFEWRWKRKHFREVHDKKFESPPWLGDEPVDGKTVLLHKEQGLGDVIQMLRYIPLLAARGARVIADVPGPLASMAATVEGVSLVVAESEELPAFDLHCPFMSLPLAFKTMPESIPSEVPYLRIPEAARETWRNRLGSKARKRIGLVWSGSAIHPGDRNRSIALQMLLPLLDADADFYSLQKEYRDADRDLMSSDRRIRDLSGALNDFADTAALIEQLDLVITVDTSVAHLAGALGRPVWITLAFDPDYRWLMSRVDSPWYPTARLFRQSRPGDWAEVVSRIAVELQGV